MSENIKFKAIQYFGEVTLYQVLAQITIKQVDNYKLLILMKRIRDAIRNEAFRVEECIRDIKARHITTDAQGEQIEIVPGTIEFENLNAEITSFLRETEIEINYPKLKASNFTGFDKLAQIDAVEGIIEFEDEPEITVVKNG